jgi:REP element-mobilizing transposase RayT
LWGVRSRLFYHIIWTTRGRQTRADAPAARFLQRFIPSVARRERSRVLAIGIVATHVHVLVETHQTTSLPRLVQRFKGGSSVLINREGHSSNLLRWQKGYAIHTVGPRGLEAARAYVLSQDRRHPDERIPVALATDAAE